MSEVKVYTQDVATMSDDELRLLSAELEEHYDVHYSDEYTGKCYCDEAADRYQQLVKEIERRRWEALTPEQQSSELKRRGELSRYITEQTMKMLVGSFQFGNLFRNAGEPKIGDTITVKTPPSFVEYSLAGIPK